MLSVFLNTATSASARDKSCRFTGLLPVAPSSSSPVFASWCGLPCECLLVCFCLRSVCAVGILFVFLITSHTDMYVVATNPRGPWIRFHVPPRRHPYSARDISCSLVLRVGTCQLMRIQGLRAVTNIHRQFCCTKGAHVKVSPSCRLLFRVVVHNTNLDWHSNCSWHFSVSACSWQLVFCTLITRRCVPLF